MLQDPRPARGTSPLSDPWIQARKALEKAVSLAGHDFLPAVWASCETLEATETLHPGDESLGQAICNYLDQCHVAYISHRGVSTQELKHLPPGSLLINMQEVHVLAQGLQQTGPFLMAIEIKTAKATHKLAEAPPERISDFLRKLKQSQWLKEAFAMRRQDWLPVIQASFLVNALALATPLFSLQVYDRIIPNQAYASLAAMVLGVLLCLGFDYLLKHARHQLTEHAASQLDARCTARLTRALLAVRPHGVDPSGLLQHIRSFEQLRELITGVFLLTLIDLPFLLLFALVIGLIHPLFLLLSGSMLALGVWAMVVAHPTLARHGRLQMQHNRQAQSQWMDTLANLEMVQATGTQHSFARHMEHVQMQARLQGNALRDTVFVLNHRSTTWQQLNWVFTIVLGVHLVIEQHITMGGMIAVSMLTLRCFAPLQKLQGHLLQLHAAQAGFQALDEFLANASGGAPPNGRPLPKIESITLQNVSVYASSTQGEQPRPGNTPLLQHIDLKLQAGARVGVIGATGAGKTSLLRLLAGLMPPNHGQYTLNGLACHHYHPSELARQVGLALQPPLLLKGTLLENLQFNRPHVQPHDCWKSLENLGLDRWVRSHPDGLHMPIESQGSNLSAGQRQAISLCRAIAGQPKLLLLDEPTVCLDQTLENRLMAYLRQLPADVMVVFSTHKLSMLPLAEQLVLMHQARIHSVGDKASVLHAAKQLHAVSREQAA
ncbi:peptidase domain-containing ABC transporter [Limnobacter sp.]|uniref:peptidase domain-containing ABC transporter n=1 Tax=Limnobacter sp. TaxID=2003368 RepID=UPI0035162EE7